MCIRDRNYYISGATYGVFSEKDCTKQLATLTTDGNGNTDVVEVTAGTVYIKELSAPAGYKVDKTVYSLSLIHICFLLLPLQSPPPFRICNKYVSFQIPRQFH